VRQGDKNRFRAPMHRIRRSSRVDKFTRDHFSFQQQLLFPAAAFRDWLGNGHKVANPRRINKPRRVSADRPFRLASIGSIIRHFREQRPPAVGHQGHIGII
jgi:hypothetical protein